MEGEWKGVIGKQLNGFWLTVGKQCEVVSEEIKLKTDRDAVTTLRSKRGCGKGVGKR